MQGQYLKQSLNLAQMTCIESNAESVDNAKMNVTVPSSGDYYLFIDSPIPNPRPFVYTIGVEQVYTIGVE